MTRYCIADGYQTRPEPLHHDDTGLSDEYQREVYEYAREVMRAGGLRTVLDIGCGSGHKLLQYLGEYETTGTELEPCLSWLSRTHPQRRWLNAAASEENPAGYDLIVCSDVIEHLLDPDALLARIRAIPSRFVLFSTPDRQVLASDARWSAPLDGPPLNPCHVREWTFEEFQQYLKGHFRLVHSAHARDQLECQYHLCAR
jgi:SAM-dependent methyltransferase